MSLKKYFEATKGFGVLATASADGSVDVAVYARPHVVDAETLAFIMADRLSHRNLQSNPHAAYLFREGATGDAGKRLHLTRTGSAPRANRTCAGVLVADGTVPWGTRCRSKRCSNPLPL